MSAYYNENDKFAAAWLRELIKEKLITDGEVDERSITDVRPDDLRGFVQCHFFAGIGGWSYALRLAGWPDDREVWTGSCPCQPFSSAGKGDTTTDPRHLWPTWKRIIDVCRPTTVFGEQVNSPDGRAWLDAVSADLEGAGYAFAPAALSAGSINAPYNGSRLHFVASTDCERTQDKEIPIRPRRSRSSASQYDGFDFWRTYDRYPCADGLSRPIEPGTSPMADGVSGFVGRLRGYGNAINPRVAQVFIEAYCDARGIA